MKNQRKSPHSMELALVTTLAAAITLGGCSSTETQRCVDQDERVLPSSACQSTTSVGVYHSSYRYPHWVYGGSGGTTPGNYARGYSSTPRSSSVVHGGFGFHGGGFGFHGGG